LITAERNEVDNKLCVDLVYVRSVL